MGTEVSFSADNVYEFLKTLVETGDAFYIDAENRVIDKSTDEFVGVRTHGGKNALNKAIGLYKQNQKTNPDVVAINPFTEVVGYYPEKDWFFGFLQVLPGCLIRQAIRAMADYAVNKEKDADFKSADIMSEFIERMDKTFIKELETQHLRGSTIGFIFYKREKQIAQLQSAIFADDFEEKMKGKLRLSSIRLIRDIMKYLLETDKPTQIYYEATLIGCPRMDAIFHVLLDVLKRISSKFEALTGVSLKVAELDEHAQHLEAYHKAMQWYASSSSSPTKEKKAPTGTVSAATISTKSPFGNNGGMIDATKFVAAGTIPASNMAGSKMMEGVKGNFLMAGSRFSATLPTPKPVPAMMRGMGMRGWGGMGGGMGMGSLSF